MPGFVAVLKGPEHVYDYVNPAYLNIAGDRQFIGKPIRDALPELAGQGFFELLDRVYRSGTPQVMHGMPARLTGETQEPLFRFRL